MLALTDLYNTFVCVLVYHILEMLAAVVSNGRKKCSKHDMSETCLSACTFFTSWDWDSLLSHFYRTTLC